MSNYEKAKQELAAFKFSLFETIAADPLLQKAQCLNLIIVYASLVTIDQKTLKATTAYASNSRVFVRAGLRSAHTAIKARRLLEQYGYLEPVGKRNSITVYRLENPHQERVMLHVIEAEEFIRERSNEQKRARINPAKRVAENADLEHQGIANNATPEIDKDCNNCNPRIAESARQGVQLMQPITFNKYLSGIPLNTGHEGKDVFPVVSDVKGEIVEATKQPTTIDPDFNQPNKKNEYAAATNGDDENAPFPVPTSQQEADEFLTALFGDKLNRMHALVLDGTRRRLMSGRLTPEFVRDRLNALVQ